MITITLEHPVPALSAHFPPSLLGDAAFSLRAAALLAPAGVPARYVPAGIQAALVRAGLLQEEGESLVPTAAGMEAARSIRLRGGSSR